MSKLIKYLAIGIIALVLILIGIRMVTNYNSGQIKWDEDDRDKMIGNCIETLGSLAIRFPGISENYCECTADTLMVHFGKGEYLLAESKSPEEKDKEILPVILKCYNEYSMGRFDRSKFSSD